MVRAAAAGILIAVMAGGPAAAAATKRPISRKPAAPVRPASAEGMLETASLEFPDLETPEQARTLVAALQGSPGVQSAVIDVRTRLGVVHFDPASTGVARLLRTCQNTGVEANEYRVESRFPKPIKLKGG